MTDHHSTMPALSYREGGKLRQVFYGFVYQVAQSAG